MAPIFFEAWGNHTTNEFVDTVLMNSKLWGTDLSILKGFSDVVKSELQSLMKSRVEDWIGIFENRIEKKS